MKKCINYNDSHDKSIKKWLAGRASALVPRKYSTSPPVTHVERLDCSMCCSAEASDRSLVWRNLYAPSLSPTGDHQIFISDCTLSDPTYILLLLLIVLPEISDRSLVSLFPRALSHLAHLLSSLYSCHPVLPWSIPLVFHLYLSLSCVFICNYGNNPEPTANSDRI